MRTLRTTGSGSEQTLNSIEDIKIPVYDTTADAEADLANLAEGQIVGTKDVGNNDEQTLMEYVDGRLETTTTEIAMDAIKTGSKAQLYKSGNNVQFRYFVQDSSTFNPITGNTWVTIATIPEGLRPKTTIYLAMQGAYGGKIGSVMIDGTTGNIQIYRFDTESFGWEFSIQCDYNVDGTNSHGITVNTLKDAKDYTDAKIATVVPVTKNLNSVNTTATMDYYDCIRTILADNNISSWDVGTYMGTFTSSGVSPNIWCGTYLLTKTHTSDYGTMVIGNANGQAFTATNAPNGWQVRIENALIKRSANGNFVETYDAQQNRVSGTIQYRCHLYGVGPLQEFIDFIQAADYANIRGSNGIIAFSCNGTPNIYGKNKYDLNGPWTLQYTGAGALYYYFSPKFYCPANVATTDWSFFVESAWDNVRINPADWIAAGNAQVFVSIEVIK